MKKHIYRIIVLFITLLLISSCSNKQEKVFTSVSQLNGQNIGCMSGSIFD